MNYIRLICITIIGSSQLLASSYLGSEETGANQIISLLEINERTVRDFSEGKMGGYILECPEGTHLPLEMILSGEFLALESHERTHLKILKTCYIQCKERENFLFSTDLKKWETFSDFFIGKLKVSLNVQNDELVAEVELELNQRKAP